MIKFSKMNGLGNDFVIIDERAYPQIVNLNIEDLKKLCDRKLGIGCDQLIVIRNPLESDADIAMGIYNPDGTEVEACGNATRCIGFLLSKEKKKEDIKIKTKAGVLTAKVVKDNIIEADMGKINPIDFSEINIDSMDIKLNNPKIIKSSAISVGNPHLVCFIKNFEDIDIKHCGEKLEHHYLFKNKTNVEFVKVIDKNNIQMQVWERGTGITLACGTGACASAYAAYKLGLCEPNVKVQMLGGDLDIYITEEDHTLMCGEVSLNFIGEIEI